MRNLLAYAALKLQALRVGATAIERKRELVNIKFSQKAAIDPGKLARFVASQQKTQFTPDGTLKFSIKISSAEGICKRFAICWKNWKPRKQPLQPHSESPHQ